MSSEENKALLEEVNEIVGIEVLAPQQPVVQVRKAKRKKRNSAGRG